MTESALAWVPCLDLSASPWDSYAQTRAALFVRAHQGRGHFVIRHFPATPLPLTDCAARTASGLGAWESIPGDFQLDQGQEALQASVHIADASEFAQLIPPYSLAQIHQDQVVRLIVYRRPHATVASFVDAVAHLHKAHPDFAVWVDQPSAGWDALSYMLALWGDLQALHIADTEVSRLWDIARLLHRPVSLQDFGSQAPKVLPALPEYPALKSAAWGMTSLPIYPGYL